MKRSDWITILSVLLTTMGSVMYSSYKLGRLDEKVSALEKVVGNLVERIPRMEVEIAEIKVKVDALWQRELSRTKPIKDTTAVKVNRLNKYSI